MGLFTEHDLKKIGISKSDGSYKAVAPSKRNVKQEQTSFEFEEFKSEVPDWALFIPGEVRSKKNSKRIVYNKATGKPVILSSEQVMRYTKETKFYYSSLRNNFLEMIKDMKKPYKICFYFVFSTRAKWDYPNMVQLPLDLMVEQGWLEDDNCYEILPEFKGFEVNKHKPGLYIFYDKD